MFSNNKATAGFGVGGGLRLDDSSVIIKNNLFSGNTAAQGGAIYISDSDVEAKCNTFNGNTVTSTNPTGGGAISVSDASFYADYNTFISNVADEGGALFSSSSVIGLKSNTFSSNTGRTNGGAIYSTFSSITLVKDIFASNSATVSDLVVLLPATIMQFFRN